MILHFRLYDREHEEMEYYEDYSELSDMFINLDVDDGMLEEPMQSTGLRDMNGKEIYEGDILKWNDFAGFGWTEKRTGKVFYNSKECKVELTGGREFYMVAQNAIIIGNIFQNPHLLEADSHE